MFSSTVNIHSGMVSGVRKDNCVIFRGIPYAKADRFEMPKECPSWSGVRECTQFGPACYQTLMPEDSFYGKEFYSTPERRPSFSEDCLNLNIWTPECNEKAKYPVAIWIHGGAFNHGFNWEVEFDGEAFCKRGVILVSINYRVGVWGFLAHSWLSQRSKDGISGNYGIYDQLFAIRWVKNNISAFGGDPDSITIMGQSAGAMSVQTLVSSPLTKGLIKGAILQSGGGYNSILNRDCTLETAEATGLEFTKSSGIGSYEQLMNTDCETLLSLQDQFEKKQKWLTFVPNIDGKLLAGGYNEAVENGTILDIDYMIGSTLNDIAMGDGKRPLNDAAVNWSLELEKLGRRGAYVYDFRRALPGDDAGAFHTAEVWYTFGTLGRCWRPFAKDDYELSDTMTDDWTSFCRSGKPADKNWVPYTASENCIRVYDI
ncbi:MAG: carboxylesterase family protein [Lachnospiraceae bacterium]|nr:carboxylesterase family protein [Lachnospiraceae bacterium]